MSESAPTKPATPTAPSVDPQSNTLHPSKIDLTKITDKDERKIAEKILSDWHDVVDQEVSELLQKHGVSVYVLSVRQDGMRTGMLFARGDLLNITKLSSQSSRYLKKQIDTEVGGEETES